MKRTEIAMIILIASLSMFLTFMLVRSLFGDNITRTATVKEAVKISDQIDQPAKRVFNKRAINPTVEVCVQTGEASTDQDVTTRRAGDCDPTSSSQTDSAAQETDSTQTQTDDTNSEAAKTNDN